MVFGPLDAFAYKVELRHENWRNVRHLLESGVDFGLMTDHPVIPQRNLLLDPALVHPVRSQPEGSHRDHHAAERPDPGNRWRPRDPRQGEMGVVLLLERGPVRHDALPRQGRWRRARSSSKREGRKRRRNEQVHRCHRRRSLRGIRRGEGGAGGGGRGGADVLLLVRRPRRERRSPRRTPSSSTCSP